MQLILVIYYLLVRIKYFIKLCWKELLRKILYLRFFFTFSIYNFSKKVVTLNHMQLINNL